MSLKIQHLNADSTFLLRFHPPYVPPGSKPFTILIDPWLHSDAPVYHRRFSTQEHTLPCHISSLRELEFAPNVVLVSQGKSDHCHEGTLKELDWSKGTKLVAVPDAVGVAGGWKWFDKERLRPLKKDLGVRVCLSREGNGMEEEDAERAAATLDFAYLPAKYPWSLPSVCSGVGIKFTFPTYATSSSEETISILYTPHGVPFSAVSSWISSLPPTKKSKTPRLSLLLHPFSSVHNPPYLGGTVSHGFPSGLKICQNCDVGVWMSAHDEDKKIGGFIASKVNKNSRDTLEVVHGLREAGIEAWGDGREDVGRIVIDEKRKGARVLALDVGEDTDILV